MRILNQCVLLLLAVQGSRSVLWPCTTSQDCSKVPEAKCSIYGYCQCPAGYVFSSDVTSCLSESPYGVACEEAVQCSHMLTGAKCENGFCTCNSDYTYVRGRCRQLVNLHESCSDDIDCFFSYNREAVVCRDGTCKCAPGFYERSTNVCRRRVGPGEFCLVHEDCIGDDVQCIEDRCVENAQTKTFRDVGVQATPQKTSETGAKMTQDRQQQTEDLEQDDERRGWQRKDSDSSGSVNTVRLSSSFGSASDDVVTLKFGDSCVEETRECPGLPYSVCRMGQCHCKDGFFNVQGACKAELGEYVQSAEDCGGGQFSSEGRCVCQNNQFYNYNMRTCSKGVLGIGSSCTLNSQCSPYGLAYCSDTPKRCTCYPYAKHDAQRQLCVPKDGYEEYCDKDDSCTLENTRCSEDKTCVCRPNYFFVNERCKAGKGGACKSVDECGFDKAVCESEEEDEPKKCDCIKGHIYNEERCLKEAEQYEDDCVSNEQCQPLLGDLAKCIDEKCQCNEDHTHYKDGKCHEKKSLDERCSKSSECFVEDEADNVECRNSSCQCKFEYSPDVEHQRCVRPSGKSSSDRPSALKVITLLLTSAAVLITGSALWDAYNA